MGKFNRDTALLVIDVQAGLFDRTIPVHKAEELLANVNALLRRARRSGAPVFIVQHGNDTYLREESAGWRLHPQLDIHPTDGFLRKSHGSAFKGTPLSDELQRRGITGLVVCGLVTHGCVDAACTDALEKGYRVTVAADGHSSYHKRAAALVEEYNAKWAGAGIEVLPSASI